MKIKLRNKLGKGWAWEWPKGEICHWAVATKEDLIRDGKPSPEATPIAVYIVKRKTMRPSRTGAKK